MATDNKLIRITSKADQASANIRDRYAALTEYELMQLDGIANILAAHSRVGIVAAMTILMAYTLEHLRRATTKHNTPSVH